MASKALLDPKDLAFFPLDHSASNPFCTPVRASNVPSIANASRMTPLVNSFSDAQNILAFCWLALRTLTFWVFVEATMRSPKVKLFGGVRKSAKFDPRILGDPS